MKKHEIEETLEKQLQLLSECSKNCVDTHELADDAFSRRFLTAYRICRVVFHPRNNVK